MYKSWLLSVFMNYLTAVHANLGRMMAQGKLNVGMNYTLIKRPNCREISLALVQEDDLYRIEMENEKIFSVCLPKKEGLARIVLKIMDTAPVSTPNPEEVQTKILAPLIKTFGV